MNKIYLLLLTFLSTALPCKAQLKWLKTHLHKDGAHITAVPRFSPLYDMPLVPLRVKVNKKEPVPFYNDPDALIGVDIYRYAPSKPLSYGFYLDAVRQQLTLNDAIHPTFTTHEVQFKPYIHCKTQSVSSWWHVDFNLGGTVIYAPSFGRSVSYYYNGKPQYSTNTFFLNPLKFEAFAGSGITIDLLERDKHEKGLFEQRKIKLLTANVQWNIPLPLLNHSNLFKNTKGVMVPLEKYQNYLAKGSYFTFTVGTRMDLFKYEYYEATHKHFGAGIGIDSAKWTHFLLPPNYLKSPSKDYFGGFHVDMTVAAATLPLAYQMEGNQLTREFRAGLNYAIGYNFHFWGNYKRDTFVEGKQDAAKRDFFAGLQITNRNYVPHQEAAQRYVVTSYGATVGVRRSLWNRHSFGLLGLDANWNFSKKLDSLNKGTYVNFVPKITVAPFLGMGWRNIVSVKVKWKNPLYAAVITKPHILTQLEWWISMGF